MSCLYSSPEVSSVELLVLKSIALKLQALKPQALDCRRHRRLADRARLTRDLIAVQFDSTQILPYVAVNKDAFPTSPADAAGCIHSACQNKHRFLAWLFKRNIRLSFALRSRQRSSLKPSRSNRTCVLEPFTRGGLSL